MNQFKKTAVEFYHKRKGITRALAAITVVAGGALLFQTTRVLAGTETAVGSDVAALAYRAVTIESWDRDYTGSGYGWEVVTDKDIVQKGAKYEPAYANFQVEREVKLLQGTPQDIRENVGYDQARILGVKFAFTFPGHNSVSIRPPHVDQYVVERPRPYLNEVALTSDYKVPSCYKDPNLQGSVNGAKRARAVDCIYGVEMPGIVKAVSVWVCGRGNKYTLEGWIEDWRGDSHILRFGSLDFIGWRPLVALVPTTVPQTVDSYPPTKTLVFKKLLIRSQPKTSLETVYIYFDELRVLTKIFEVHFDGAQIDFDRADCEKKNHLLKMLRRNARFPGEFQELSDCSKAPGPAAPISSQPPAGGP